MYIVREKETKTVLTVNPAALDPKLDPKDIYADFDPKSMEIGWTNSIGIPEHFKINQNGEIVELTLKEKAAEGIIALSPNQKIENDQIIEIEKTEEELVKEGVIKLSPHEKLEDGRIVPKPLEEKFKEGLIELAPHEKIENGQIVQKNIQEQVDEGLILLNEPFEYADGDERKERPIREVVEGDYLKTLKQCQEALKVMDNEIEEKVSEKYSPGYELKLTKRYMEWVIESKPQNDSREQKYLEMQSYIEEIKKEYKPLRAKVRETMNSLT